jgi:hypothetical protein
MKKEIEESDTWEQDLAEANPDQDRDKPKPLNFRQFELPLIDEDDQE